MFRQLSHIVSRYWPMVILAWLALAGGLLFLAPRWDEVTFDGDLAFLPNDTSTVRAEQLMEQAFPHVRGKSQLVLMLAREDRVLDQADMAFADELAVHMGNLHGAAGCAHARALDAQAAALHDVQESDEAAALVHRAQQERLLALDALDDCLAVNADFAAAYHNRALICEDLGRDDEAEQDRIRAWELDPGLQASADQTVPADVAELPLRAVWSRHTDLIGDKLLSADKQALLLILQLGTEFMATENIELLTRIEAEVRSVQEQQECPVGLQVGISGSAAVGGDMLRSAAESIQNTELYSVLLVAAILIIVYRAPLLVLVPMFTILVSLVVALRVVAALTQLHLLPGMEWWDFKIFTTTKIFVVVILYGAGTDFCLFLISRYREELLVHRDKATALIHAQLGVSDALTASALTTILGLGTMFFAEFGKFRNSGPAIGLCLTVTLLACLTLAPALLRGLGGILFWPWGVPEPDGAHPISQPTARLAESGWWHTIADSIIRYPGRIMVVSTLVMLPFAICGAQVDVTYNLLSELEPQRPSKVGSELLRRHFPIGEAGPIVVLARRDGADFGESAAQRAISELTEKLHVDGVVTVRSLTHPMGETVEQRDSLLRPRRLVARNHPLVRALYVSEVPPLAGDVTRFEIVGDADPFSPAAGEIVGRIDRVLAAEGANLESAWYGCEFLFSGTTAAIIDLRNVTTADNRRIQVLVTLAVLAVLLVILKRPIVCLYLILSVLLSYYVTVGITELFFQWYYGPQFEGLDWKVPLFLFVILVAIGQDYNIYLATRVFEEQPQHGLFGGLHRAIVQTGGIITSCGVIMAGTFVSMTTGTLHGIVELGFALSVGVMLDTFVVRPVLVPSFLALLFRWQSNRSDGGPPDGGPPDRGHPDRGHRDHAAGAEVEMEFGMAPPPLPHFPQPSENLTSRSGLPMRAIPKTEN